MSYSAEVLADSPTGYWRLDDTSGTTAEDATANNRDGTYAGSPSLGQTSLLPSGGGTAVALNGSTQRVSVAHNTAFEIPLAETFSFECWVKLDDPTQATLQVIGDKTNLSTSGDQWVAYWDNRNIGAGTVLNLRFRYHASSSAIFDWSGTTARDALAAGGHLVCTTDSSTIKIYWNGAEVASGASAAGGPSTSGSALSFGAKSDGSGNFLDGTLDEVAVYQTTLSAARVLAHYNAATTQSELGASRGPRGFSAGVAVVPVVGTGGATAPHGSTTGAASVPVVGGGASSARTGRGAGAGSVGGIVTGAGASAAPQGSTTGSGVVAVVGVGTSTAPRAAVAASDPTSDAGAESYAEAFGDADGPITVTLDAGAESYAESGGDAAAPIPVETEVLDAYATSWATAVASLNVTLDPATNRPQPRLVVVDMEGTELARLDRAVIGNPTRDLNSRGVFDFTLPKKDPMMAFCTKYAEVQVWRGGEMVPGAWYFIKDDPLPEGATTVRFTCVGLRGYFEERIIGDELPELLANGGFEDGESGWNFGYAEGSVPAAPPLHRIVTEGALEGGKALELAGADKSQLIKKTLQTVNLFYPNRPYADEPLSAGFMPGGEQAIRDAVQDILENSDVTVEGHTADADAGTGFDLSVRRAEAAAAVILDERPDLFVTSIGKGESEPVDPRHTEAAYRKNRRVVIIATTVQEATGHRQYAWRRFTYTNPSTTRVPISIDLFGWVNLVEFRGPSKDGWIIYIERRNPADLTKLLESATLDIDDTFPLEAWQAMHAAIKGPADDVAYRYEIRAYPTAGKSLFDHLSVKPGLITAWWHTDQCLTLAGLVQHGQDVTFGKSDLKIGTYTPASGMLIDRPYEWSSRTSVDAAIEEIISREDGPDFEIEVTPTKRVARTYWPRKGSRHVARFALGDRAVGVPRITSYAKDVQEDKVATTAIMQSSLSRGGGQLEAFVRLPRPDGLVIERVFRGEQDRPVPTLLAQGRTAVRYGRADVLTRVTMDPAWTTWLLENVAPGDTIDATVIDASTTVDDVEYRIIGQELNMATDELTYDIVPDGE